MVEIFDNYSLYPANQLKIMGLPSEVIDLLSQVGLPTWVAPNMHFGEEGDEWLAQNLEKEDLRILGSDRDDNPICIDVRNGVIVRIKNGSPDFFASSVFMLSAALEEFQSAINRAVDEDSKAFTDQRIPAQFLQPFVQWLLLYEPQALEAGTFWQSVLQWLSPEVLVSTGPAKADGCA